MIEIAFLLLFMAMLMCFSSWRQGFLVCVITALLQDPMRKMLPGQPVYMVVFVGAVFGAAFLGAMKAGTRLAPNAITGWRRNVGLPVTLFVVVVVLQGIRSMFEYGNPVMTGIGLMSYLAPLPAIVLAYRFALSRGEAGLRRWMGLYVVLASLALTTVYLEFSGVGGRIMGEVGGGVMISGAGAYYKGNSGIFRAAEIAAWHAATVACFSFMLFWGRRFSPPKVLVALLFVAFLLGIGALTGRRKMVIEIAIFLSSYFCLLSWFKRGNGRLFAVTAIAGLLAYTFAVGLMNPDAGDGTYASERVQFEGNTFLKYSERATTVFADAPRRVMEMGVSPVYWAVSANGWLGAGLGLGSQGAQHFGRDLLGDSVGAAEGGLGKFTVELGVPGLCVVGWMLLAFGRYVWRILSYISTQSASLSNLAFGLVAFMLANIAAFSVATQAYGDLFILLSLGWSFGFLVALPVLVHAASQAQAPQPPNRFEKRPRATVPPEYPQRPTGTTPG